VYIINGNKLAEGPYTKNYRAEIRKQRKVAGGVKEKKGVKQTDVK
jgi:hypothetical protein